MKEKGFSHARPILVNSKLEIIDGQHRFLSAKKLGISYYYVIDDNFDYITANTTQMRMSTRDFIKYYAIHSQNKNYIRLQELTDKYNLTTAIAFGLYGDGIYGGKEINNGLFLIYDYSDEEIEELTKYYKTFVNFINDKKIKPSAFATNRNVAQAFNILYRSKKFNFSRFLHKLYLSWKLLSWDHGVKYIISVFLAIHEKGVSKKTVSLEDILKNYKYRLKG